MKKLYTLLLGALLALSAHAAEITYRVASYNADAADFVIEAWGEKPQGAIAYFENDFGATTGNRYNQIPRNRQASFVLFGWQGCTIKGITFSMCSNNKSGTIGYSITDGDEEIYKMNPVDFASSEWFGEWLSKDHGVYADITKTLNLQPLSTDTLVLTLKGGTAEGSVYINSITIHYEAPEGLALESPMGWVYEKLEKKSTIAEGDVIMLYRSGDAACDIDGMATSKYLDAIVINSTSNVTEPEVLQFTLGKEGTAWTLTDQFGRRLGASGAQNLTWDAGVTTWNITLGYDGATIASTNTKYGTLRYNAPATSYPRFWNYTSTSLALPYAYRRVRQNQPLACSSITLNHSERTVTLGEQDTIMVKATVAPVKATDKRVTWHSSNPDVATVKGGIVHPVGMGTAIITATTVSGGLTAEMRLTVNGAALLGDVNGDGEVNVTDVTALVNHILGTTQYPTAQADINADGEVNVTDVTALINIILGTRVRDKQYCAFLEKNNES
ncbi:MAG: dockerin type I domain-containing protein, partial [Bacteroidales bacterium]|nr:dockerin type I domain-containing protein [Bacteroidales bacterium]